ncbi:protein of unknown function [Xenorhabdus poinarii G6]|uniref:Uncharacterized protein n=1 Tax=Xenorhabdus poinarii G6 TaxID=1354304 RepID=A0A068R295_9GAMM|nr:protein of unknown function [Xenorhabdus poinarii G6]
MIAVANMKKATPERSLELKSFELIFHDVSLYQFEVLLEMVKYKIGDCQKAKNPT